MCVQSESMEFVGHHFDQELGARNARSLDMTRCKVWICISLAVSESEHSVLQSGGVWSSPEVDNDTENLSSSLSPDYLCDLCTPVSEKQLVSPCACSASGCTGCETIV